MWGVKRRISEEILSEEGRFSGSEEETREIARGFVEEVGPDVVISLEGELGAGKTCFVRGLAEGCGFDAGVVSSPTFPIVHEYRAGVFAHLDVYRLRSVEELDVLGFDDYVRGPGVCVVEWGDKFPEVLPRGAWRLVFEVVGEGRRIRGRVVE